MFRAVDGFIRANPLRSNIISATLVSSCGDGVAQLLEQRRGGGEEEEDEEEGKTAYDVSRTVRVGLWGTLVAAPVFTWLRFLDRVIPGATVRSTALKVAAHQGVCSPIHNSIFYGYISAWTTFGGGMTLSSPTTFASGRGASGGGNGGGDAKSSCSNDSHGPAAVGTWVSRWKTKLEEEFVRTQCIALCTWGPANAFVFYYVPLHYRVVVQVSVGVVWTSYLSMTGHR